MAVNAKDVIDFARSIASECEGNLIDSTDQVNEDLLSAYCLTLASVRQVMNERSRPIVSMGLGACSLHYFGKQLSSRAKYQAAKSMNDLGQEMYGIAVMRTENKFLFIDLQHGNSFNLTKKCRIENENEWPDLWSPLDTEPEEREQYEKSAQ